MLFNSLPFLYFFLPVAYFVFWRLSRREHRYLWLTISGYVFYSFWNYRFCALMLLSTVISYCAGLGLLRFQDPARRRLCLFVPVTMDLLLLGVFKYGNFALSTATGLLGVFGVSASVHPLDITLPVGISFYTFHTITYIVDAYHGLITPTTNFFEFSSYVSLFPQLVAGPIVRFRQIEGDLGNIEEAEKLANLDKGWSFFTIGLVKKVLVADTISMVISPALADYAQLSTLGTWLCVLGFTYQIYYDFSGYSDMAVGLGYLFGLRLPQNFNSPFQATDMGDFWRRWHVSMSSFFRDYVYIPLGGNRVSASTRVRNVMITMLIAGLWHGANWTFVLWGGFIGFWLLVHRALRNQWKQLPLVVQCGGTFLLFAISMAIFRSTDLGMASDLLVALFSWRGGILPVGAGVLLPLLLIAGAFSHFGPNTFEMEHRFAPARVAGMATLFAVCLGVLYGSTTSTPFIYFQF